jgi:signal transduction histidine kinase
LAAHARGITLTVMPVEDGVAIEADRQVLAAVVMSVLQNAFTFTRPRTTVTLRVGASADRVLLADPVYQLHPPRPACGDRA